MSDVEIETEMRHLKLLVRLARWIDSYGVVCNAMDRFD